jgi:hypothetical protein
VEAVAADQAVADTDRAAVAAMAVAADSAWAVVVAA